MATIINTLEVVLEPPRQAASAGGGAQSQQPPQGPSSALTPMDLSDVSERRARYVARLLAH